MRKRISIDITLLRSGEFSTGSLGVRNSPKNTHAFETQRPRNKNCPNFSIPTGQIDMESLLKNFRDFIARAGFKILQVPDTPQESVGRHLLLAYLDQFVKDIGGFMHIEVQTGRGRMDIIVTHNQQKYIIETKIWRGESRYQAGKRQLAAYLRAEGVTGGDYVVFDHREKPEPRVETETIDDLTIRSYVIPVMQELPSKILNPSETQ